jgi:multiple sugar transport system permease protein
VKATLSEFARFILLAVIGVTMALPFCWMVSAAFKTRAEVEKVDQVNFVPKNPTTDNFPIILNQKPDPVTQKKLDLNFGRWYFNSIMIAVCTTTLQVLTSAMAAFAFSRLRWKGRDQVFLAYLATMMIPGVVTMIPNFQMMVNFNFLNTYHGLIIPAAFSAFGTFLLRQFMLSVSPSLDEAAKIDGAGVGTIFWDIVLPLARPGLVSLAILTFLGAYQSFYWPLIMLNQEAYYPLGVGLMALDTSYGRQTELIMAAAVLTIIPMIIIFVVFQKLIVKGLQLGGVKG